MATAVENWDEDADFHGDLFSNSMSVAQSSISSRVSIHSESVAGDEDWQVLLTPNDDSSTQNAIAHAKQAGIPLPSNVPSSALLGGSIKKLSKRKSNQKMDDDWGEDLELPPPGGLKLKKKRSNENLRAPTTPAAEQEDDFDEWAEGSLGIRFAGTKRGENRNRSSSASAMSPSLGSCMTLESEDDGLDGLVLPNGPLDFEAALRKRKLAETEPEPESDKSMSFPVSQHVAQEPEKKLHKPSAPTPDSSNDDFFADIDIGRGDVFDPKKLKSHRNIQQKNKKPPVPTQRSGASTTLTFTDKSSTSRIPRPLSSSKSSAKLEPVLETGAAPSGNPMPRSRRPEPTTTSAQLLRSKRSMPMLRNSYTNQPTAHPKPFLPAGNAHAQSHNINARPAQSHSRRDSDPNRSQSPTMRSHSRLSNAVVPDTPSRTSRRDVAPPTLTREASVKRPMTRPTRRRNFGDGSELEHFDDLPTSASKESRFVKQPSLPKLNGTSTTKSLRQTLSHSKLQNGPDRTATATPMPPTPRTPSVKLDGGNSSTPRFARDTAASRIAREQRLNEARSQPQQRPRAEGPLMPVSTNWKAQVAARSPHASPGAQRKKKPGALPQLIKPMGAHVAKTEKGMTYNPLTLRWEGNENALHTFETQTNPLPTPTNPYAHANHSLQHLPSTGGYHTHQSNKSMTSLQHLAHAHPHLTHAPSGRPVSLPPQPPPPSTSPPRPALIAPLSHGAQGVQVVGGMVFDPRRMCWLKMGRNDSGSVSGAGDEDDDPFKGLDDLPDERATGRQRSSGPMEGVINDGLEGGTGTGTAGVTVHEEFDVGPEFIRRQREEELLWRKRTEGWFGVRRDELEENMAWKWSIRDLGNMR
ncbi:hypothetical protein EV356DRAFT_461149 [Viridothelium virens]|uniref:Cytokinesis regulator n=1 Tax=Viridothelium virens TaxID=1048519 RepID=A0A6A6HKF1_VIRVR|nr:hypothetical protein EV356DRAFT_461149 [Viridothelium virens]